MAAAAVLPFSAFADSDTLLPSAVHLLAQRQPAAAHALLIAEEPRRAGEPSYDYLLGITALDAGHVTHAIFALERVVAVQPDNALAHAELARAYLAAGETDGARTELRLARQGVLPTAAALAIDRVLGALDPAGSAPAATSTTSAHVEFGLGWDSNVNSANRAGEFAIPAFGGLLFTVPAESRRRSDGVAYAGAGGTLQAPLSTGWKLIGGLTGRTAWNARVHEMDTGTLDATLGLGHTKGAHEQTLALQSNIAWVGSGVYRKANGASAQWQTRIDTTSQWSAFVQWARQAYDAQPERDTDRTVVGAAYARAFASTGTLGYGSVYDANERVRDDRHAHFGHHALGWRLGAEQGLGPAAVLFAEVQGERRRYGGTEPLFDVRRVDRQVDVWVGLRWRTAPAWSVVPSVRHTRAQSQIPFHDHERTVVQVLVRKEIP